MAQLAIDQGYRRVRHSAALSLAAISVGATAGVLLPTPGDRANAVEPNASKLPHPSEATGNPYQALPSSNVTLPYAPVETEPSDIVLETNPPVAQHTEFSSEDPRLIAQDASASEFSLGEKGFSLGEKEKFSTPSKSGELSPPSPLSDRLDSRLDKNPYKVANGNVGEQPEASTTAPTPSVEMLPISVSAQESAPAEIAKTPGFSDETELSAPVEIPVPPPETAIAAPRVEEAPAVQVDRPVVIPVPPPETTSQSDFPAAIEEQQTPEAEQPQPELLIPEVASAPDEQLYRVKPGDTIDAIALRYGVSRADLIRANDLSNPHQIQIDQELTIPQPESVRPRGERYETVIPGFTTISREDANGEETTEGQGPVTVARANTPESVVIPTKPSANLPAPEEGARPATATATLVQPEEGQDNQGVRASDNPYIERLKADIMRMREEYRAAQQPEQDPSIPEQTVVVASEANVNPEWQVDRQQGAIAVESTSNQRQTLSVRVIDNRSDELSPIAAANNSEELSANATQVAAAPANPQGYNPNLRPSTGTMVSPQLPSLSPDRYLPDAPAAFNGYIWPTTGVMTSGYGPRWGRMHRGIDIAGPTGTPIVAAAPGEVVFAGWNSGGFGNLVDIRHPDGSMTRYAHNSKILVRKGQQVEQGERISLMGSTGYSTGPHLHFEVHPSGRGATNPMAYLPSR